ncbi:hypothetical protein L226DRAFT_573129 [Lentinus tigrinus ALCF2SS1-7]|uniref:uncharacterized protein n=1 Tax=Lentinus tigrinus ALCF2SS1-7 TaxID=1328758 RepID=UPI001165CB1F|nr:hypothetical protein L226DRAFT_573129 [Lentinus tigrinus ALCF2SS1-7]
MPSRASRVNLPGADDLYMKQYQLLFKSGQYRGCEDRCVFSSSCVHARHSLQRHPDSSFTAQVMESFKQLDSLELAGSELQPCLKQLLGKWLKENELTCSEELGDVARPIVCMTGKLHIIDRRALAPRFTKKAIDVYFPPEATNDFPVTIRVSKKQHAIVYLVIRYGLMPLHDLESGKYEALNGISTGASSCVDEEKNHS